jgi:hypothetical protein
MNVRNVRLTKEEIKYLLDGVDYGTLSRDELEHAIWLLGWKADQDDRDSDLVCILKEQLA